ncbi:MAG: YbaB/EbfC family nucleoid-associated protein [Lewinella sp.]|nr:YbaB/EbfC family nucleoid-associated protein [Lewinella sp.]
MMGQMKEMQGKLKERLRTITLEAEAGDGAVKVTANAAREIVNVTIDPAIVDAEEVEAIEDLVVIAVNRALALAAEREAAESQTMIQDMLPPGLGGLGGLFGQ